MNMFGSTALLAILGAVSLTCARGEVQAAPAPVHGQAIVVSATIKP